MSPELPFVSISDSSIVIYSDDESNVGTYFTELSMQINIKDGSGDFMTSSTRILFTIEISTNPCPLLELFPQSLPEMHFSIDTVGGSTT